MQFVKQGIAPTLEILEKTLTNRTPQQKMYADAMPKQFSMLYNASHIILPFFKSNSGVLKRNFEEKLAKEYGAEGLGKCPLLKEGQEFYADWACPEGFCNEA